MTRMLQDIVTELETERLFIKKYEEGDGKGFFQMLERNNNREALKEHVSEASDVKTKEDAEIRLRGLIADWITRKRFVMGIWLKAKNIQIGQLWIEVKKWEVPLFELGWFVDAGYQKKGIATEAARRALQFLFEELKAHKIEVVTRDYNEPSHKLAERLGFTKEGHLREHGLVEKRRFGLLYYGMLRSEYEVE